MSKMMRQWVVLLLGMALAGCAGLPTGIDPVKPFDAQRYLGTWYEIARLDHRFERGLSNVSATYSQRDNGQIRVVNQGFNSAEDEWTQAEGRAKFVRSDSEGYLKVSFFGPFYGSYVVFDLDADYQQAFVAGNDRSYLWYLSRSPTVSEAQKQAFLIKTKQLGFPVDELIFVDQSLGDRP